jgi:hypothetical protein
MNTKQALKALVESCESPYGGLGMKMPSIHVLMKAREALDNGDALLGDIEDYLDGLADGASDAPGYAKQATVLLDRLQNGK